MTRKEQALYALMEEQGYSYGCMMTSIQLLSQSKEAQDDIIDYLYSGHHTEQEFIERLADLSTHP
ncbi:MAG: hypothetical protein GXY64_10110 [Bacteroidales bacterium]|nr:hypothetical protein [Bacteroidales bacterium]